MPAAAGAKGGRAAVEGVASADESPHGLHCVGYSLFNLFVDPDDPETRVLCSNVRPDQSPGNYGPLCGFLEADMVTWRPGSPFPLPGFNLTTWRFFEAPWLSKIGGRYYLSYMMHGTDIGYAVSDDVLGNYTPMGALMWTPPYDCDDVDTSNNSRGYGPNNHQGMVEFPAGSGEHYLAYHTRKLQQDRNLTARARRVDAGPRRRLRRRRVVRDAPRRDGGGLSLIHI